MSTWAAAGAALATSAFAAGIVAGALSVDALKGSDAPFDVATGNDADADRHGIVTPDAGLMNPNHYLAAAVQYLFSHRPGWPAGAAVGKTLVSSSIIDLVVAGLGRRLFETPVGFKWFVDGLLDGAWLLARAVARWHV